VADDMNVPTQPAQSSDIVTRLRHVSWLAEEGSEVTDLAATAADEIERLRAETASLIELVDDLYSDEECDHDHHGYCQTHMWFNTVQACPHVRAADLLAAYEAAHKEGQ